MTYKSFRLQMRKCKENGNRVSEQCATCEHELIMCKKYGGQCRSHKCIGERTNDAISAPNKV